MTKDREEFIKELAVYLSGNLAEMSIRLEMKKPDAIQWSKIRRSTPVSGWVTVEETEEILRKWFSV